MAKKQPVPKERVSHRLLSGSYYDSFKSELRGLEEPWLLAVRIVLKSKCPARAKLEMVHELLAATGFQHVTPVELMDDGQSRSFAKKLLEAVELEFGRRVAADRSAGVTRRRSAGRASRPIVEEDGDEATPPGDADDGSAQTPSESEHREGP